MRGETQAVHLAKMMKNHKLYPEYELALPLIQVKKNSLKRLSKTEIFLLGFENLDMILLEEGRICANVAINEAKNSRKIQIIQCIKDTLIQCDNKKYETVKISFGMIQSRKLEVAHTIGVTSLNLQKVTIFVDDKPIAKGSLVNVDEEIAVQIDEVI